MFHKAKWFTLLLTIVLSWGTSCHTDPELYCLQLSILNMTLYSGICTPEISPWIQHGWYDDIVWYGDSGDKQDMLGRPLAWGCYLALGRGSLVLDSPPFLFAHCTLYSLLGP
jgi:hypothetical protein